MELARCHICAALLPDTPEDRAEHVGDHKNTTKRLDAMTDSLRYLDARITELLTRITELQQTPTTAPAPADGLTINEFPEDEIDPDDDVDLAPVFDAVTTDLADLHDITQTPTDPATDDAELDARIATLNATGGPVA